VIRDNLPLIEDILIQLINPEGVVFTMEQLVRDYGYPDVDVDELDIQWM